MSDWQQAPQPYEPPVGMMPPAEPKPRRTGVIVAVVVAVLLLACCCMGVAGVLIFSASKSSSSSTPATTVTIDPAETKRLEAWGAAKATFPLTGYATVAPDARQRKLADAATELWFPDFAIDELLVHPGTYDATKKTFVFDEYIVLMHLKSDPAGRIARAYAVTQPAADSLARADITVESNESLERIGGTSWLLGVTDKVVPLMKGIKDPKYAKLVSKVAVDWPGGVLVRLQPSSDGSANVRIFTWESYSRSDAAAYVDVVYADVNGTWKVQSYDIVNGSSETTPAASTP